MKASRYTTARSRSGTRSAAPVITQPPYEWPQSTTSVRFSHRIRLTTSATCVSRFTCGEARCDRSATPVSVGVNTSWPARCSERRTRCQHQPPCQAPCTRTKVAIVDPPEPKAVHRIIVTPLQWRTAPRTLKRRATRLGHYGTSHPRGRPRPHAYDVDDARAGAARGGPLLPQRHNAAVQSAIPPERLFVYEVGEGGARLCRFLGVPVPAAPFPRVNTREECSRW